MGLEHSHHFDSHTPQSVMEPHHGEVDSGSAVATAGNASTELIHQLAMTPNGPSVWPEPDRAAVRHRIADRHHGVVPPRPHPEAELHDWPTQSGRDLQRLQDFWDAMPLAETAVWIVGALGAGLVVAAVMARFAPLAMAALRTDLGRRLGALLAATTAGTYFNQWFEAAWTASDDPKQRQQKIEEAREAFKKLGTTVGVAGLQQAFSQPSAATASTSRLPINVTPGTSNLPVPVPQDGGNLPLSVPQGAGNLSVPLTHGDADLVPMGSAVANHALDAVPALQRFGIQGNDGRWYPTPSGGSFGFDERVPGADRLQTKPDFTPPPLGFARNFINKLQTVLTRELGRVRVLPLQIEVNENAGEQFAFSAEHWTIRIDALVVQDSPESSWLVPRLQYAFARAVQSWEVIRYMHLVRKLPTQEIERYFAKHAVAAAIKDTTPLSEEQQVTAEVLLDSITKSQAARDKAAEKSAERERLAQAYNALGRTLSALKPPLTQEHIAQYEKARWEWHDAHLAAMKAADELGKFPHERSAARGNAVPYEALDQLEKRGHERAARKAADDLERFSNEYGRSKGNPDNPIK